MVLKLYSVPYASAGCGLVAMVLAEKQRPFELIVIDIPNKDHKTAEYIAKHPFGQVPVIDDDGFVLYESRAICRYLAEKYAAQGTALIPTGLKEKALVEQAASVEFANFLPSVTKVGMESIGKHRHNLPVDEAALAQAVSELAEKLDVYEVILAKQKFIGGNDFTLADIFHLYHAPLLAEGGIKIMTSEDRPNVTRWWNDVISRPTWVQLKADGIKSIAI
ncbi:glutathione S-transferase [Mycena sp. CBHHK59/15]|nr:glutathione S-transferase [Mycena sp. CBHHK59/15]